MATLILNSADLIDSNLTLKVENFKGYFTDLEDGEDSFDLNAIDVIMYREGNKDILIKAPNKE